jgi:hypothetical protein
VKTNQPFSGEIRSSSESDSECSVGVLRHGERWWISMSRVTARLAIRWNAAGSSSITSAIIHFSVVQAALLTAT